ncbi:MAG TPA: hypothetical protein VE962_07200 [Actinomycetota bacterium]|nr:hypothetical protein [Actinomycetota bacterium]
MATFTGGVTDEWLRHVEEGLLAEIRNQPELFCLEAHNAEFPDGAIRGELA